MITDTKRRRTMVLAPLLLFLFALIPRLWALDWGLPYVEHSDEPALVETVVRMLHQGDPNPGKFLYPSLYYYALALVFRLYAAWGIANGSYSSVADLPEDTFLFTTSPLLYVWGRVLTALLGAAIVPLLFILGRRMFDWRVGLLAAAMLALSRYHVEHSHFITTDVPTGLWVTLAVLGAWRAAGDGRWPGYLLCAVAVGLAAGTKYNAGVIGLVLIATALIVIVDRGATGDRRALILDQGRKLIAAGALALLVFLATTPYALLDWASFRRGMQINAVHYASGSHGDFIGRWRVDGYLSFFWREGIGALSCLTLAAGVPLLLRRFPRQTGVLLAAVLICVGLLLTQAVNFDRNTLPIIPLLFLLIAAAAVSLADWIGTALAGWQPARGPQILDLRTGVFRLTANQQQAGRSAQVLGIALLAALLIGAQAAGTFWLLSYWSRPHSLELAASELRAQPRGMLAAVESNPVQWAGDPAVAPFRLLGSYDADWYRARGYRYLLLNRERYDLADLPVYERLLGNADVLLDLPERRFGLMPGPGGALLDLGEHLDLMPFVRREVTFGAVAQLQGYELRPGALRERITPLEGADERVIAAAQPLQINLYWRALAATPIDYTLFVHVYNAANERVAQRDLPLRYQDYPTSRWQAGELVIDRADLPLPELPPGEYRLEIGLYDAENGALLASDAGPAVVLTTLTIDPALALSPAGRIAAYP